MPSTTFMILTGGKASRFGSSKSEILFDGATLFENLLQKLPVGNVVVVGSALDQEIREVKFIRESPAGGGPVSALGAGIDLVEDEFLVLLAVDLPFAHEIIPLLLANTPLNVDAVIPVDSTGNLQMLCAIYRAESLRTALGNMGSLEGKSMKALTSKLNIETFALEEQDATKLLDIDTQADLVRAIEIHEREKREK
jgi:molybdopterin-guanine dinucleotide biosynthesis protein A